MSFTNKDINLIPEKQQEARSKRTVVHYTRIVMLAAIFLCVINLVFHAIGYGYLTYSNALSKKEIENLAIVREKDQKATLEEAYIARRTEQLAKVRREELPIVPYLEVLENVLPVDFASKGIDVNDKGGITISGSTPNEFIAGDVLNILASNKLVLNARMENLKYTTGRVDFDIVGTIGKL